MVAAIIILSLFLVCSLVALTMSLMLNRKLMRFAERFEKNYTQAQDILDESYAELETLLARHMVLDDPIARKIITQLNKCRDDVYETARLISMQEDETEETDDRGN